MLLYKNAAIEVILLETCPALYSVHNIDQCEDHPQRLPLSYERVNRDGIYLMDTGTYVYLYVCAGVQPRVLESIFGVNAFAKLDEDEALKQVDNQLSERLHSFLRYLHSCRGSGNFAPVVIISFWRNESDCCNTKALKPSQTITDPPPKFRFEKNRGSLRKSSTNN
uniref:Gelsolin-like domain-containing protein n=1 Tax=Ditylenchus dipsaci TaxID=166011 RepID=A0A915CYI6_9BILA